MSIHYNKDLAELSQFPVLVVDEIGIGESQAITYEQFVCNLVKQMGSLDNNITHMTLGIAGEAGEIVDAVKKKVIYDKPLDVDNLLEELGDLEFYMAGMRQLLGISRREVLAGNVAKLEKRYVHGYSDAAAIARADKTSQHSEAYQKLLAEQGKVTAINLPSAAVAGTDDMAGLSPEAKAVLDSLEPTQGQAGFDNPQDQHRP